MHHNGDVSVIPRAEPLVRRSGGGAKPPEAESILVIGSPTEPANLAPFQKCPFELPLQVVQKFYVEIQGGSGDRRCPFLGASMCTLHSQNPGTSLNARQAFPRAPPRKLLSHICRGPDLTIPQLTLVSIP